MSARVGIRIATVPLAQGLAAFSGNPAPPTAPPSVPSSPTGSSSGFGLGGLALVGLLLAILGAAGPALVAPADQQSRTPSSITVPQTQPLPGHAERNLIE